jgi:hypothetical protein
LIRFASLVTLLCLLAIVPAMTACQRPLPPEVPYDPQQVETLREDFDELLEP